MPRVMRQISLDEFVELEKKRLEEFREWYLKSKSENPDQTWPTHNYPPEWAEQFLLFND